MSSTSSSQPNTGGSGSAGGTGSSSSGSAGGASSNKSSGGSGKSKASNPAGNQTADPYDGAKLEGSGLNNLITNMDDALGRSNNHSKYSIIFLAFTIVICVLFLTSNTVFYAEIEKRERTTTDRTCFYINLASGLLLLLVAVILVSIYATQRTKYDISARAKEINDLKNATAEIYKNRNLRDKAFSGLTN